MPRKKNRGDNQEENRKGGGKLLSILIVVLLLVIWLVTFGFLIKMDVGNLGTSLRPMLKDVPVLKYLLPSVSDEQLAWEENYPYRDMEEAVKRIKELERREDELTSENSRQARQISSLEAENERLRTFEEEQEEFARLKREFDRNVVFNPKAPEIDYYAKFYEAIYPVTAEEIYRQVIEKQQYDQAIQTEAKRLSSMKPGNAAKILEEMNASMELVAQYLLCMKVADSAAIMEKMDSLYAAHIMQKIADMNAEKLDEIMAQMSVP